MSDKKKICPLRFACITPELQACIEDKCAWYLKRDDFCAIKTLAYFAEAKKS